MFCRLRRKRKIHIGKNGDYGNSHFSSPYSKATETTPVTLTAVGEATITRNVTAGQDEEMEGTDDYLEDFKPICTLRIACVVMLTQDCVIRN